MDQSLFLLFQKLSISFVLYTMPFLNKQNKTPSLNIRSVVKNTISNIQETDSQTEIAANIIIEKLKDELDKKNKIIEETKIMINILFSDIVKYDNTEYKNYISEREKAGIKELFSPDTDELFVQEVATNNDITPGDSIPDEEPPLTKFSLKTDGLAANEPILNYEQAS